MKLTSIYKRINNFFVKKKILTIRITENCNLNCFFCVNRNNRLKGESKDFTYKDLLKIKDEIKKNKPKITLMGGEIFLNKDLFKMIKLLRSINIDLTIYTNGFFVKENIKKLFKSGLEKIYFSLDHHVQEKHNMIRGNKNSYQRAVEAMRELHALYIKNNKKIEISIATVINKKNYKDLVEMYRFIEKSNFINSWSLQHLFFYNKNAFLLNNEYKIDEIQGEFIQRESYFSKKELIILKDNIQKIEELSRKFKTKLLIKKDVNRILDKYYSKDVIYPKKCNVLDQIRIKKNKVYNKCGLLLGDVDEGVFNLFDSKKNKDFIKHIKKEQIIQCFRCCARKF